MSVCVCMFLTFGGECMHQMAGQSVKALIFTKKGAAAVARDGSLHGADILMLYSRISGEASVDGNYHAVNEAGSLAVNKPKKSTDEIVGLAETTHGGVAEYLVGTGGKRSVGVEEKGAVLIGGEEAGRNRIDSDTNL